MNIPKNPFPGQLCLAVCLTLFGSAFVASMQAEFIADETAFELKLHNEYRNSRRPVGPFLPDVQGRNQVEAWVQGVLLEGLTENYFGFLGIEANYYYIAELYTDPDKFDFNYLRNADSFDIGTVALTLEFSDAAQFKIGRFGTDHYAGSLDYDVPIISARSLRVIPEMREGILYRGDFGPKKNLHVYALYSTAKAGYQTTRWTDIGSLTGKDRGRYATAVYYEEDRVKLTSGVEYTKDHSWRYHGEAVYTQKLANGNKLRYGLMAYYAAAIGESEDFLTSRDSSFIYSLLSPYEVVTRPSTWSISGKVDYITGSTQWQLAFAQYGDFLDPQLGIDTTRIYPFCLTMDALGQDIFFGYSAVFHRVNENLMVGANLFAITGYEDAKKEVPIDGVSSNIFARYKFTTGFFKGLEILGVFNPAQQHRPGSQYGEDVLDWYDMKIITKYSFSF